MANEDGPSLSEELDAAVLAAQELARGERRALSEHHLALVLCEQPGSYQCLRAGRVSADAVAAVARKLASASSLKSGLHFTLGPNTRGYDKLMGDAVLRAYEVKADEVLPEHWLLRYLLGSEAAAELEGAGLDAFILRWHLVHGFDVARETAASAGASVTMRLHNDDITSREFVVGILTEIAGLEPALANELMLKVHHEGVATIGTFPHARAHALETAFYERAREKGFPLRVSVAQEERPALEPAPTEHPLKAEPLGEPFAWEAAPNAQTSWSRHEVWIAAVLITTVLGMAASSSC